jgi:hypothetical protein
MSEIGDGKKRDDTRAAQGTKTKHLKLSNSGTIARQ